MDLIDILLANKLIEKKLPPTILNLRGSVSTTNQLPLTNNHKGDVWVVQSNNAEYVWMSDNASGSLSDYEDFGPVIDLSPYRTAADQDVIDSGKQSKVTASGILKGDGNGGISAAVAGTDYSNIMPGDPYPGVDLTEQFAAEIANYTDEWAWIKARIQAGNFSGIHVGDYIPVMANSNTFKARIMGINTYKGYGDTGHEVGNHIDWIFEELWPTVKSVNPANYNNGLIPKEDVVANGTDTSFVLTKEMNGVAKIEKGGSELSGWSYDPSTYTITFTEAPAAGTMTVTGTGTEFPWLASDAYHFVNSLAGQVPNGTTLNPPVKHVDYTHDGIYYHLPQELKDVIIQKRAYLPKRYSATGVLSNPNAGGWADIGYIWFPTEVEVYGCGVWGNTGYEKMGSALQYHYFMGNMNRAKKHSGSRDHWWMLSAYSGNSSYWCYVASYGHATGYHVSNTSVALPVCFRT